MVIYVIDMQKINELKWFYKDQYPEIRIYCVYDPCDEIVYWDFHANSSTRYESYSGKCIAYGKSCELDNTEYVVSKMRESLLHFLNTEGVKVILCQSRLEKM